MNLRATFMPCFPAPGLPDPLSSIAPLTPYVDSLMKQERYRTWSSAQGAWYAECGEIAKLYWGYGSKKDGLPMPTEDDRYNIDALILNAIKVGSGSHKEMTHRQICQGVAMLRRWKSWLGGLNQGLGEENKENWDEAQGVVWENELTPNEKELIKYNQEGFSDNPYDPASPFYKDD